jgi:transposase
LFAGIFDEARSLVHDRAERAIRGNDPTLASFARQILDPSVSRPATPPNQARTPPDFAAMHEQLRRNKYVTLQLLWEEYRQAKPDGYRYSRFCYLYQRWRAKLDVVLRQEHKAGEKMFVDWAGATISVYDRHTGIAWQAPFFVAALAPVPTPGPRRRTRGPLGPGIRL